MTPHDTLLLVDASSANRTALRNIFEESFNILESNNCEQAALFLKQAHCCIAAILLNVSMLSSAGSNPLPSEEADLFYSSAPVIGIADETSPDAEILALNLGAADVITTPFHPLVVRHRLENILSLYRQKWNADSLSRLPDASLSTASSADIHFRTEKEETAQSAYARNQALLHYLNITVGEVDLDRSAFRLLYNPNPDLAFLRTASTPDEAYQAFISEAMSSPDSPAPSLPQPQTYLREFFASGSRKQITHGKIYNSATDSHQSYNITFLRIDPGDFTSRKALILFEKSTDAAQRQSASASGVQAVALAGLLGIVQSCRNDQHLTMFGSRKGLFSLVGYTEDELESNFQNRLMELVLESDRAELRTNIIEQLSTGNNLEVEFQLRHKDGHNIWVLTKGYLLTESSGEEYLYGMMLDISQSKKAQEGLRLSLERHQIIMEQANDIVFELDCATDTLTCSPMWEKRFGYPYISEQASVRIPKISHFHPDDMPILKEKLEQISSGVHYAEMEARIANATGRYTWNRLRASVQQDQNGNPLKVIGVIIDIDNEKRKSQALQDKAERDSLTKLYNKNASRQQIEDYLEQSDGKEHSALLIIDLDNFKEVNDRYGHMFGDAVLIQASAEINSLFRGNDIVSRIGGDEFMIFMKNIPSRALVENRCQKLISSIHNLYRDQLTEQPLSCSIGIAFSPDHGTAYQELFQRADRALYKAKGTTKGRFECYDLTDSSPLQHPAISKHASPDTPTSLKSSEMIRYIFDHLYESRDAKHSIYSALELAGKQLGASRAYIVERNAATQAYSTTHEWCNVGIAPTTPPTRLITDFEDYETNFNERGIFYCSNITQLPPEQSATLQSQDVKSLLQCAIRENGDFRGFIGFDDCAASRLWTQEQIDLLTVLSQSVSLFLPSEK